MQLGIVVGDMRLEFGAGRGAGQSFEKDRQILDSDIKSLERTDFHWDK